MVPHVRRSIPTFLTRFSPYVDDRLQGLVAEGLRLVEYLLLKLPRFLEQFLVCFARVAPWSLRERFISRQRLNDINLNFLLKVDRYLAGVDPSGSDKSRDVIVFA